MKRVVLIFTIPVVFASAAWCSASLPCQAARAQIHKELTRIRALEQQGMTTQALDMYKSLYQQHPENGSVFVFYKNACMRSGKYGRAVQIIQDRIKSHGNDQTLQASLATALYRSGDSKAAYAAWDSLVARAGTDIALLQLAGHSMLGERLFSRAAAVYTLGKQKTNRPEIFSLSLIDLYISQLDYKAAGREIAYLIPAFPEYRAMVEKRVQRLPPSSRAVKTVIQQIQKHAGDFSSPADFLKILSALQIRGGMFSQAIETEWKLHRLNEQQPGRRLSNLARKLFNQQEYNLCVSFIKDIRAGIPGGKHEPELMFLAAQCREAAGQYKKAAAAFEDLAVQYPQSPYSGAGLMQAGILYMEKLSDAEKAAPLFQAVLADKTAGADTMQARFLLGTASLALGNTEKAARIFSGLRADTPQKNGLWVKSTSFLGKTLYFTGNIDSSMAVLKQLYTARLHAQGLTEPELNNGLGLYMLLSEHHKEHTPVLLALGRAQFLSFCGRNKQAIAVLDSVARHTGPGSLADEAVLQKAGLLSSMGQHKNAAAELVSYQEAHPGSEQAEKILFLSGTMYERSNMNKQSIAAYETFLRRYPSSLYAGQARTRLRKVQEENQ